jgi:hypothetical protein
MAKNKTRNLPIKYIRGDSKYGPILKHAEAVGIRSDISDIIRMARYEYSGLAASPRRPAVKFWLIGL